jgi:hypothetical protein
MGTDWLMNRGVKNIVTLSLENTIINHPRRLLEAGSEEWRAGGQPVLAHGGWYTPKDRNRWG